MEKHTKNGEMGIDEKPARIQYQNGSFKPKATLLLNILPDNDSEQTSPNKSAASAIQIPSANTGKTAKQPSEPEDMLKRLLLNTEASAQRIQSAKMKWQMATLALGVLFAPVTVIVLWLLIEMNAAGTERGRLEIEKQSLKEQLNTASMQITGLKKEIEIMLNRNLELVGENSRLKSQTNPPAFKQQNVFTTDNAKNAEKKSKINSATSEVSTVSDSSRIDAIKKGKIPSGASKAELTAALGEPDRIYKSRKYEQLVYFGKKPGRFWLVGGYLVQASD